MTAQRFLRRRYLKGYTKDDGPAVSEEKIFKECGRRMTVQRFLRRRYLKSVDDGWRPSGFWGEDILRVWTTDDGPAVSEEKVFKECGRRMTAQRFLRRRCLKSVDDGWRRQRTFNWAATWQNQQNECAPSEDSDQRRLRLGGCPGWSESSLGARSFSWFCHVVAYIISSPMSLQIFFAEFVYTRGDQ